MAGPRISTIRDRIGKAIDYLDAGKAQRALAVLRSLADKMDDSNSRSSTPKKPNAYALYVQERFESVRKENPTFGATDVLRVIAKEWKAKNQRGANKATPSSPRNSNASSRA